MVTHPPQYDKPELDPMHGVNHTAVVMMMMVVHNLESFVTIKQMAPWCCVFVCMVDWYAFVWGRLKQ